MEQRRFGSTDLSTSPIAETIGALQRLRADGKIRYYGVSNHDVVRPNQQNLPQGDN